MASLAQQFTGLRCSPLSFSRLSKPLFPFSSKPKRAPSSLPTSVACAYALTNEQRERQELKQMFEEAYERCITAPLEGVSFTLEDFEAAVEKDDLPSGIGATVRGTVFDISEYGAMVDIPAKTAAFLPTGEACIYRIRDLEEAGIFLGMNEEFLVVGEDREDNGFILSWRGLQYDLAWERCRQLQAEDVVVKGRIIDTNNGGAVTLVEGLRGFIPFSQMPMNEIDEEALIDKELLLKFVEVDEENSRLVLSNRKAVAESQAQLGIGSVVSGTVQSLKPYGAFIDIGGINGLLHVSQISHDRVADIGTVLQPGDTLKVMILSHDRERGRVSLSTKKLEPTPGDMIRNPQLVFEKADEMAQTFRQRIAQAEAMARADMLRFQPESGLTLSSEGILGPLAGDQSLDFDYIPPAEDIDDDDEVTEDEDLDDE